MIREEKRELLRGIPAVDEILLLDRLKDLRGEYRSFPWTHFVRSVVEEIREDILSGSLVVGKSKIRELVVSKIESSFESLRRKGLKRVINGTGVILHTNLGRAVLGAGVMEAIREAGSGYVSLEFDLERGERTQRGLRMNKLLAMATGAEASMVVNNNAAAVYLVASTFSPPGRIIVSRGELVEIGGSFRLPSILSSAAQEVIEVGTTNRTYVEDYAEFARENDILLKVHRSNYAIEGFTHEATLEELVSLAASRRCYAVYDVGSGAFFDFEKVGLSGEQPVRKLLATGVDCITMSGDKLLGGVQAGLIVGKSSFMEKLKQSPIRRAFRVDKISIAAIETLLHSYLFDEDIASSIPVLAQISANIGELKKRVKKITGKIDGSVLKRFQVEAVDDTAAVGGGSFSREEIPGVALRIKCRSEREAVSMARKMRNHECPIIPRVRGAEVRINMRSVLAGEDEELAKHLGEILVNAQHGGDA